MEVHTLDGLKLSQLKKNINKIKMERNREGERVVGDNQIGTRRVLPSADNLYAV